MTIARKALQDPDNQKVSDHDSHVIAIASPPTPGIIADLEASGIRIARISKPNKSFVIGSYALALASYRGDSHAWLPISYDVAVEPSGPAAGTEILVELKQDDDIRAVNEASFRKSNIVAARSEVILRSLTNGFGYA